MKANVILGPDPGTSRPWGGTAGGVGRVAPGHDRGRG